MQKNAFDTMFTMINNIDGKIALIDIDKFEYLDEENNEKIWKKLKINELEYLPIVIHTNFFFDKNTKELHYNINYELLISHTTLCSSHTEKYTFLVDKSKKEPYSFKHTLTPNEDDNLNYYIKYNNENADSMFDVKHRYTVDSYISRNKQKLFSFANMLNSTYAKTKTYKK